MHSPQPSHSEPDHTPVPATTWLWMPRWAMLKTPLPWISVQALTQRSHLMHLLES